MGFPEDICAEALERYDGDENLALNYLLGGWDVYVSNLHSGSNLLSKMWLL